MAVLMPRTLSILQTIKSVVVRKFVYLDTANICFCYLVSAENKICSSIMAHTYHKDQSAICVMTEVEKLPAQYIQGILWLEIGHLIAGYRDDAAKLIVRNEFGVRIRAGRNGLPCI